VISDPVLFGLQKGYPPAHAWHYLPELTWKLVKEDYLPLISSGRTRRMPEFENQSYRPKFLIVSNDVIDAKMGGPGVRYLQMARALCDVMDITLAVPVKSSLEIPGIRIVQYAENRPDSLRVLVDNHDVALVSGYMSVKFPFLERVRAKLVVDLYDPFFLENLYYYVKEPMANQVENNRSAIMVANRLVLWGDYFICGNERQRDFWTGFLAANGRISPENFAQDPSMASLIDVVGVGIPESEPERRAVIRGVHPLVPQDAQIVLWGGGIWNWLDPLTLVRAWPQVIAKHPKARLVFLGTKNPNPVVPVHEMVPKVISLAEEVGEKDKSIIFIEWLTFADHEAVLFEADLGVTLQPADIETRYSIRTRVIDYFRARLPILVSEGDITSEWITQYGLGEVIPTGDVDAAAAALNHLLDANKEDWNGAYDSVHASMGWKQVVAPLREYCLHGHYAPDRLRVFTSEDGIELPQGTILNALQILRTKGIGAFFKRAVYHLLWLLNGGNHPS
jgi:glycosyltransferase involved in cell wall biosynthesis